MYAFTTRMKDLKRLVCRLGGQVFISSVNSLQITEATLKLIEKRVGGGVGGLGLATFKSLFRKTHWCDSLSLQVSNDWLVEWACNQSRWQDILLQRFPPRKFRWGNARYLSCILRQFWRPTHSWNLSPLQRWSLRLQWVCACSVTASF